MEKAQFDERFTQLVADPLQRGGFRPNGWTLTFDDGLRTMALLRLGGRLTQPGAAAHVLCFRHSFLREIDSGKVPRKPPSRVSDYPFKFFPKGIATTPTSSWRYEPSNSRVPREIYDFSARSEAEVTDDLKLLTNMIIERFVPWTNTMTPAAAVEQIKSFGENAWCERLWLDDYTKFVCQPGIT